MRILTTSAFFSALCAVMLAPALALEGSTPKADAPSTETTGSGRKVPNTSAALEAVSSLLEKTKGGFGRSPVFLRLAKAWLSAGDKARARQYVARALILLKTEGADQDVYYKPAYYLQAAEIYLRLGDIKDARAIFKTERFWESKPDEKKENRLSLYKWLAPKFAEAGDFEFAEELLKKIQREGPCAKEQAGLSPGVCTLGVHAALGLQYARKGNLKRAAEYAKKAEAVLDETNPGPGEALLDLAKTHLLFGERETAIKRLASARKAFEVSIHGKAEKIDQLVDIAYALEEAGRKAEADQIIESILVEARESSGEVLFFKALQMLHAARWHLKRGSTPETEKLLARAVDVAVASVHHYGHGPGAAIRAAEILNGLGDEEKAARILRTVLDVENNTHADWHRPNDLIEIAEAFSRNGLLFDEGARETFMSSVCVSATRGPCDQVRTGCDHHRTHWITRPEPVADKPSATRVAPLFRHGRGAGSTGDFAYGDATFLSEEIARETIIAEMAKAGITFDRTDFDLNAAKLISPDPGVSPDFVLDGYSTENNLGFEYVSLEDTASFGGITCGSHDQDYDLGALAGNARAILATRGKVNAVVFYDPVILRERRAIPLRDSKAVLEARTRRKIGLLTAQVKDAIAWIQSRDGRRAAESEVDTSERSGARSHDDVLRTLRARIMADTEGENVFDTVTILLEPVLYYLQMDRREKAIEALRKAQGVVLNLDPTAVFGAEAEIASFLSDLLLDNGLKNEARDLLRWGLAATDLLPSLARDTDRWQNFVPRKQAEGFAYLLRRFARLGDFETVAKLTERAYEIIGKLKAEKDPGCGAQDEIESAHAFISSMDAEAGVELAAAGEHARARACLDRARDVLDPAAKETRRPEYLIPLAVGYRLLGETATVENYFKRVLDVVFKNGGSWSGYQVVKLAKAFDRVGDFERVEEVYARILRTNPANDQVRRELAEVLTEAARWHAGRGRAEKAAELARSSLAVAMADTEMESIHPLMNAVVTLARLGAREDAAKGLRAALDHVLSNSRGIRFGQGAYELAIITGAYDATGIAPNDEAVKTMREILFKMETVGGVTPASTSR
ncbi:MAG: hypothetical protein HY897_25035 [Deltaproteobacteria bacterium]|nr:hypothetical protein [Deltaproteobacteria bacterium]